MPSAVVVLTMASLIGLFAATTLRAQSELVEETLSAFSEIHVLFNNAAIQVNKTVEETTVEEWNREMAVNLGGIFLCSKFFLPHLRKTKGNIVL